MSATHPALFDIERTLAELYDVVFPVYGKDKHPSGRAYKPVVAEAMGAAVMSWEARVLLPKRKYYKFDVEDFLDFATSELVPSATLADFEYNTLAFYEGLELVPPDPLITFNDNRGLSLVDCVIARRDPFVSVTARLVQYSRASSTAAWSVDPRWQTDGRWLGITLMLAPGTRPKRDKSSIERLPLSLQFYAGAIYPPCPEDKEWRFSQAGEYVSHVLEEFERSGPDEVIDEEVFAIIRESERKLLKEHAQEIELARLCFTLPAYFKFMVDLVQEEKVALPSDGRHGSVGPIAAPSKDKLSSEVSYRVVRSVRIVRPPTDRTSPPASRAYTPPQYAFAVRGHWRTYEDPTRKGHDAFGEVVFGRTWVREYTKGVDRETFLATTEQVVVDPKITVYVKQSVAYAKALVNAHGISPVGTVSAASQKTPELPPVRKSAPSTRPPSEWMATERRKLTAAMRYLILRRDEFRCQLCGSSQADDPGVRLEVDHKVPVVEWGLTEEANLWTLCRSCNGGKAARGLIASPKST